MKFRYTPPQEKSSIGLMRGTHLVNVSTRYFRTKGTAQIFFATVGTKLDDEIFVNQPLEARRAIPVRFILRYAYPETIDFVDLLGQIQAFEPEMTADELTVLLGQTISSSSRLTSGGRTEAPTQQFIELLYRMIERSESLEEKKQVVTALRDTCRDEADARKIDYQLLMKRGGWESDSKNNEIIALVSFRNRQAAKRKKKK